MPIEQRIALSRHSNICKFNIGTELRMVFGKALREAVNRDLDRFDRIAILQDTHEPLVAATRSILRAFKANCF